MENKRMTAVEWLEEKMIASGFLIPKSFVEQAKQMEYDQHCTTWYKSIANDRKELHEPTINFKQYYNKTYANEQ